MTLKNYLLSTKCVHVRHLNSKGSVTTIMFLRTLRVWLFMFKRFTVDAATGYKWLIKIDALDLLNAPLCTIESFGRLFDILLLNLWIELTFLKLFKIQFWVSLDLYFPNMHNAILCTALRDLAISALRAVLSFVVDNRSS